MVYGMNITKWYMHTLTYIQDTIAPARCIGCACLLTERALICLSCNQDIAPVISVKLSITKRLEIPVFAAGAYQDMLKRLICAKHAKYQLAGTHLGTFVWYRTPIATMQFDYIISIPLHWTRKLIRGFNQTDEMAAALSRLSGKPVVTLLK